MLWIALLACTAGKDPADTGKTNDTGGDSGGSNTIVPFRAATFNIDWLSPNDSNAADMVPRNGRDREMIRTLITEYDLSLVSLQEIEGAAALDALGFDDTWDHVVGDSGRSQNPALLYRSDRFTVLDSFEVAVVNNDYDRDPLFVTLEHAEGFQFTVVVVHHAAYDDNDASRQRQQQASALHDWLGRNLADEPVAIMGDFNDTVEGINASYPSLPVFDEDDAWRIATTQIDGDTTVYGSVIDHVILSEAMAERWTGAGSDTGCNVIYHDALEPWSSYAGGYNGEQNISSHRPVTLSFNAGSLD